jgi:hypothetical protein
MKVDRVFRTRGDGYWSDKRCDVRVTPIEVDVHCPHRKYGELRVYFDRRDWNVNSDGLIYSDTEFMSCLRTWLNENWFDSDVVFYSEQGMQGDDYVSCDVGRSFIDSWYAGYPEGVIGYGHSSST